MSSKNYDPRILPQDDGRKTNSFKKKKKESNNTKVGQEDGGSTSKLKEEKVLHAKGKNLKEEIFPIVCQWRCSNVLNIGYISINCSEKCYNQYHNQCWRNYTDFNMLDNEKKLLGTSCLTETCEGKIYEIVWVDKYGIETPKKYII